MIKYDTPKEPRYDKIDIMNKDQSLIHKFLITDQDVLRVIMESNGFRPSVLYQTIKQLLMKK
jgi:hypothetical protein